MKCPKDVQIILRDYDIQEEALTDKDGNNYSEKILGRDIIWVLEVQ